MPIEIPKIERIQPSQTTQGTRINQVVRDNTSLISNRIEAISSVTDAAFKAKIGYENQEIDKIGTQAELEYNLWQTEKLQQLSQIQDDPTKDYAEYELEENKKVDEILAKYPDLNDRVKSGVTQRVSDFRDNKRETVLKQRGAQVQGYKTNLHNTGTKLRVDNLAVNANTIYAGDESSFTRYQSQLDELKTHEAKFMLENGTAFEVKDGEPADHSFYRPPAEPGGEPVLVRVGFTELGNNKWAKERSDAATKSLEVLINMGRTKDAEAFNEKFKKYIDPLNAAKLDKKFNAAKIEDQAYQKSDEISKLPIEKRQEAVDKIKDPEVREKTDKLLIAREQRIKLRRKAKEDKNYEFLASVVMEKMDSSDPYTGYVQLQSDQAYKETWENLSKDQKQSIKEMVEAPKTSNVQSWNRVQNIFFGEDPDNDISTMTPAQFDHATRGLSGKDKAEARKTYQRLRIKTSGEERAIYKSANFKLEQRLQAEEIIAKNSKTGFYDSENLKMLVDARTDLMTSLDRQSGKMTEPQMDKFVNEYVAKTYKIKLENKITDFIPSFGTRKGEAKKGDISDFNLSPSDRRNFKILYQQENGGDLPKSNDPKFYEYVKSKRTR